MYKAAIIGCGGRAAAHIEAYGHIGDASVVACTAPSPVRRGPLSKKYGIHEYDNAIEMIKKENPDIVHIVTWPDTRVELMSLVSDCGVPLCTVEKPVASGVADYKLLCDLESASKTKFAVCHQLRWQRQLIKCREALQEGKIGPIKFIHMSAGMNISGQGTHTLNYGLSMADNSPVVRVFGNAYGWDNTDPGHPAPLATEACLKLENGIDALWTSGYISPRCGNPDTTWQHVRIAAYADRGRTLYEEFGKWEIVSNDNIDEGDYGGLDEWRKNNVLAQAGFHEAMFRWHENNIIPGTNLKQSLHEWSVVLALYQSAIENRPVEIKSFDPPEDLVGRIKNKLCND